MKWHREGVSVLASLVTIGIFALWLGRSAVKLEDGNIEACLHLNQDQVEYSHFPLLLLLKVTNLHLEGSQLTCGEGCHLAEPLLELNCVVNGWSQAGSEVSCSSMIDLMMAFNFYSDYPMCRLVSRISLLLVTFCLDIKSLLAEAVMMMLASCLTHVPYSTPSLRLMMMLLQKKLRATQKK